MIKPFVSKLSVSPVMIKSTGKEDENVQNSDFQTPSLKVRSVSAKNAFRTVFKLPGKRVHYQSKCCVIRASPSPIINDSTVSYLEAVCQRIFKDQQRLRNSSHQQQTFFHRNQFNNEIPEKPVLVAREKKPQKSFLLSKQVQNNEDPITFRPVYTPTRQQFRFPREIFK